MRLFIALRLFNESHAKAGIEAKGPNGKPRGQLLDLNVTRFHPALKNMSEYLRDKGQLPEFREGSLLRSEGGKKVVEKSAKCRLYWCEIESDLPIDYWCSVQEVEAVLPREEFQAFVLSIRCKSGMAYIGACEQYAETIKLNNRENIQYEPPARYDTTPPRKIRAA
jgi:hypothetical protein